MSNHTKGPWEWKVGLNDTFKEYRLAPGVLRTDDTDGTPWGDEIDRDNGRLIAAAPDLLEALKALVKSDYSIVTGRGFDMAILSRAIAAIDKAEGRS